MKPGINTFSWRISRKRGTDPFTYLHEKVGVLLHLITNAETDTASVLCGETLLGMIHFSRNPFHNENIYLKFDRGVILPELAEALFAELYALFACPLQIMTDSGDAQLVRFLILGGCVRARRCYSVDAAKGELSRSSDLAQVRIQSAVLGEEKYRLAAEKMFHAYLKTHAYISPFTADVDAFLTCLPDEVWYCENAFGIRALAFTEANEIAYCCGEEMSEFSAFCAALIDRLFQAHERIVFESDDCDPYAMHLRSFFTHREDESFDTYIYKGTKSE